MHNVTSKIQASFCCQSGRSAAAGQSQKGRNSIGTLPFPPLLLRRLLIASPSEGRSTPPWSKLPRGKHEATTRFANNLAFIRYSRNILPPSRTPGDCYYDAWVIQLLCGKGFLSTRKARNARSEKKKERKGFCQTDTDVPSLWL